MGLSQTAWVLIAFILFFIIVGKKLWSSLTDSLDKRRKLIEAELNEAKKLREEAQAELNSSLKKQKEINKQILEIIEDAKQTAKKIKSDAINKTELVIKRKEEQAKDKISAAQIDAVNNIKDLGAELSIKSAQSYLEKELDNKSQKKLYAVSTKELKQSL